jgi:hypothetical protein
MVHAKKTDMSEFEFKKKGQNIDRPFDRRGGISARGDLTYSNKNSE